MLFSEASGRKVVSTTTAETAGRVHDYVIDPSGPRVAALLLKKGDGDTLRWSDILAFGTDAVTVESVEKITKGADDLAELLDKRNHLHKKRVLSTVGDELGSVKDIEFDPASGTVTALVLENGEIVGSRLIGVGSYAVVVQADAPVPPADGTSSASDAPTSQPPTGAPPAPQPLAPQPPASQPPAPQASYAPPIVASPPPVIPASEATVRAAPDLSGAERATYPPTTA